MNNLNTEVKNAVLSADNEAQYDESAKRLLWQKYILAYILVNTIDEFRGTNPEEIVPLIEGTPYISSIPLEAGLTNQFKDQTFNSNARIIGLNNENIDKNEGIVRFDIVFYVRMTDGLSQIIINVEAQKDEPTKYDIINRAIFYVSRLISSQKERDFKGINYNDIKRVYSIWVCMNMSENSMCHIHLTKDDLLGNHNWNGNLDLFNIIMIGLSNELPENNNIYELHRLLCALFSQNLTSNEKLEILNTEYNIPIEETFRKDVNTMCNLSQGIKEAGITEGKNEIIINMYNNDFTLEQIVKATGKSVEEIKQIISSNK